MRSCDFGQGVTRRPRGPRRRRPLTLLLPLFRYPPSFSRLLSKAMVELVLGRCCYWAGCKAQAWGGSIINTPASPGDPHCPTRPLRPPSHVPIANSALCSSATPLPPPHLLLLLRRSIAASTTDSQHPSLLTTSCGIATR